MSSLIQSTKQTLLELSDVMSSLSDEQFCRPLIIFSGSSVGMHARHVLEFYQCLLSQIIDNQTINYDKRQRDLLLQTDPSYYAFMVNQIIEQLELVTESRLNTPLSILSDSDGDAPINSSLGRELQYNLEHTIHHSALIKIGVLTLMPDCCLPPSFGVAPSTIRHQQRQLELVE
jgi:hypothetical protein